MKKITFTTALLASACAFAGFEGHVSADGYVPGLQQGIFRDGGLADISFYATCAEADRFSHTLGTILADVNQSEPCQTRNELSGKLETWPQWGAVLYEGEMYFEGGREYNFFGCADNFFACQLDGAYLWGEGFVQSEKIGISVFSKTFKESGWHPIRVWLSDMGGPHGAVSGRIGFQGVGFGWNTNGCKVVNATTQMQWNRLLDDGSGRLLRSKVLPQKSVLQDKCGPVGRKDGEVRVFGAQDGLPIEIEMAWVAGRGEIDGFWVSKNRITQRQWKDIMGYNPVGKDKEDDKAQVGQLPWWRESVLEFVWNLNARYTGAGRFARISDARWKLAAKYCSVGLPLEAASLRVVFKPVDRRNSEREAQKLVKRGSDVAFGAMLAKGEAKRYSLADGLDLDMIKVEGCDDTFYLGRYEVTKEQYEKVMASNPSGYGGADNMPVSSVNWANATEFCQKLNALVPVEGMTWTLPSTKQWSFAANGGLKKKAASFFGGDKWQEVGWWGANEYGSWWTHPVGQKKPNELGFHDLFGNVWEWCCDDDGRKDHKYISGVGMGAWYLMELIVCVNANQDNGDYGFRVALVPATQQVVTVTDGEGKESVDGYTWSYRVKNGEAEIYAVTPKLKGEVVIPSALGGVKMTSIGNDIFTGFGELTAITIPLSVKKIGDRAFSCCGELASVTIPKSVVSIGGAVFAYCGKLKQINLDADNKSYTLVNGLLCTSDRTKLVMCPPGRPSATIPGSVTDIGHGAFIGYCGSPALTVPRTVKHIADWAFSGCRLASIALPEGLTKIEGATFWGCGNLASITIPKSVTSIGGNAFRWCGKLKSVTIPKGVKDIGGEAFIECGGLESVTMCGERPNAPDKGVFQGCGNLKAIHVPANAKSWAGMKEWQGIPLVFDGGSEVVNVHADGAKSEVSKDRTTVKSIIDGMIKVPEKDYWLSETELTQGQWESVMGDNPSERKGATLPVECVSRNDCDVFLEKLNQTKEVRDSQFVFSLPTEGEWLYATRANGDILDRAWVLENSSTQTHAVATKAANEFGFYDMQGNVWEWLANDQVSKGCRRGGAFSEGKGGCSVHRWIHTPRGRRYSCCGLRVAAHVRPSQDLDRGGMEMRSPAEKLGQCDFLLNKDFKKNAKFYLCLFSASWCGPCRAEMPRIAKTYADTLKADPDIELIHFSCDRDDAKAMAWAKEHDVKFPVVKPKGGNPLNLHARGIPHLFIVKNDGTVLEEGHPASLFKEEKLRALKQ